MGLSQTGKAALRRAGWRLPAGLIVLGTLAAMLGDEGVRAARYDRAAIAGGELWRLFSGHVVHLGWAHFLMNAIGLVLVWLLIGHALTLLQWLFSLMFIVAVMDLGFWFLDPQLVWYVGLSGALHGLLILGLVLTFGESPWENGVLLTLVCAKLIFEQWSGPLPGSESTAGGPVVVNAHLYGAVGGAFLAALSRIRARAFPAI